ncbi:hypothetical protein DRO47_02325, partial [Candidatus Bathyarchaeota archaeon]
MSLTKLNARLMEKKVEEDVSLALRDLRDIVSKVADGYLNVDASKIAATPALKPIADGFQRMLRNTRDVIRTIKDANSKVATSADTLGSMSEEVSNSVQQIAQAVQGVAEGAQNTSQRVNQLNALTDELTRSLMEMREESETMGKAMEDLVMLGGQGVEKGAQAQKDLDKLTETIKNLMEMVAGLSEASKNIGSIITE